MNIVNHPVSKNKKSIWTMSRLSAAVALTFVNLCQAAPVGGVVAAGSATISASGNTTNINQSSSKAVINWQGFNINATEAVHFIQPSSSSIALNRIQSTNGSVILGKISANGQVFLLNPNGILFGAGSQVSVGGMLASTRGISDANFMSGNYKFTGNSSAAIINQGTLSSNVDGGYIALLGANVQNNGVITARLGTVALVAGDGITIDLAGDHLLNVRIDQGTLNALVSNGNLIIADGGQVLMTAQGAGSLLASVVNNTGIIQAQTIQNQNGSIILSAGSDAGATNVSGTLDVSGLGAGSTGGNIQILGHTVNVNNANINASGHSGGGEILIGGNFNGSGPQANASYTNIDSTSVINADAIQTGNGGRVAVWSDVATSFAGAISARGGALSGNGGYVETSGPKLIVASSSSVNTQAINGVMGTWLLDPTNWTIALSGGDQTPAQVATSLASSNQTITATNDITVSDPLTWSTSQSLTLNAGHDVNVNAAVVASTAGAQFNIVAGNNANIGAAITASGLGNQINITAGQDIAAAASSITASSSGTQLNMTAGRNLTVGTATTDGGGSMVLKANNTVTVGTASAAAAGGTVSLIGDADGTGPGVAGGTVVINTAVTAINTIVRFNPLTYASTGSEVTAYANKITGGTKDIKAWVFLQANNKVYDQTTTATMSFKGTPTDASAVSLNAGSATFADKNAGTAKSVTYAGYSLGGTATNLALFSGTGTTTANITPASLTVSATGTNKIYDGNTKDVVSVSGQPFAGDSVTPSYGAANFIDPNVGNAKTVNVTGITLSGADAGNYNANTATTTVADITINYTGASVSPGSGVTPPLSYQQDAISGGSSPAIPTFAELGAVTAIGLETANDSNTEPVVSATTVIAQTPNKTDMLIVALPKKQNQLQSLFPAIVMAPVFVPVKTPVPVIAPVRPPKQGRN